MIDYEKEDKLVENCKNLYPDIPDPNMAPKVDYKNYGRIGMSIRTPLT